MRHLSGSEARETFLRFFESKGHRRVHSSSLVPANDPTLLFTNAGMNQFKDVFLGIEKRDYSRATTSQKCVRAGGKHNDLENVGFTNRHHTFFEMLVGFTNRHHTFFEMLGNFSFGDYFKKDAIAYAWELVTSSEWYALPKEKLYVTIFKGEKGIPRDDEAEKFWIAAGVSKDRIFGMGMKDNFWAMGDTGPCGPCSEIHYDMGIAASDKKNPECAAGNCKFPCECGRYVEIWNLVFMQFDRDGSGTFNPLPKPSIDTGMGLERVAAVKQGVISNYETDLFIPLIKRAAELTGTSLTKELEKESHAKSAASLRVIADHSRATTFLISDGVLPSNELRGYTLRKIIRRAIRHGRLLGQTKPFLNEMVYAVRDQMKDAYPELIESADRIAKIVLMEETRFAHTLEVGNQYLEQEIFQPWTDARTKLIEAMELEKPSAAKAIGNAFITSVNKNRGDLTSFFSEVSSHLGEERAKQLRTDWIAVEKLPLRLSGRKAFDLYQTYGLPKDYVEDVCRDAGAEFDSDGFELAKREEQERARASWKGGASKATASPAYRELPKTVFEGY